MAIIVQVKPEFDGKIAIQSSGSLNGTILSNSLPQETLYAIYQAEDELRPYLTTTFSTVGGSYPPGTIDPSLLHAYDSSEVTHNPAGAFGAGTLGKALVETKGKIDSFDGAFVSPTTAPSFQMNFAGGKFWNPRIPFSRNSIGTYIDHNGLMKTAQANKPRFTHDPVTKESLGLLMEETRTNLALNSEVLTGSGYGKTNLSIVQSASKFLNGNLANEVIEDSTNTAKNFSTIITGFTPGLTHTVSLFVKRGVGSRHVRIELNSIDNANAIKVYFDLGLGLVSTTSIVGAGQLIGAKCEAFSDGWFRISFQAILDTTSTAPRLQVVLQSTSTGVAAYQGDGVSSVLMSALQVELGLNATSYIRTDAVAVTRPSDIINITGSLFTELFPFCNEGTLFVSAKKADLRAGTFKFYSRFLGPLTAGGNNSIGLTDHGSLTRIYSEIYNNGVNVYNISPNFVVDLDTYFQHVLAYKMNDAKTYANGLEGGTDTDVAIPSNMNQFQIGGDINTIIKSVAFWPRRLTDPALKNMTSPTALVGINPSQMLPAGRGNRTLHITPESILRTLGRQEFSLDGTGASVTRNIRRPYDFSFEVVDNSGVTTMTATPGANCTANTDNALTFTAPAGKTLTYAITPVYDV